MENELQSLPNLQRVHSSQAIQVASSKFPIPDEVRTSLTFILETTTDDDFIRALSKWTAFTIYGINLKTKEVIALYLRLDKLIYDRVIKLKKATVENATQVESEIEEALKAAWYVIDNLHYSKYLILFKSLDLLVDILLNTNRFTNLIQTVNLLSTILPIFKNKNLLVVELKADRMDELILMLETFVHNLNMLSSRRVVDTEDYLATKGADKTLTPKLKILLKDPEFIVDTSRDDWVAQMHPEDPEMVDQRTDRQLTFSEVMRYTEDQMANDLHTFVCHNMGRKKKPLPKNSAVWLALKIKIMFLRELNSTQSTVSIATLVLLSQRVLQHILEDRSPRYVQLPVLPDWNTLEKHVLDPLHPKLLMHLLDAKWAKVKVQAYKRQEYIEMHSIVQKTLNSILRRIEQDRTSLDQLSIEDRDEKLVAVNEELIIACVELGSHIHENDANNKADDEEVLTTIDFSLSLDCASELLGFLADEHHDYLHFSPKLISHVMEFIKHDIGASPRVLPRILDTMSALVKRPLYFYKLEGKITPITQRRYTEFLNELVELLDSIFVEPLKGQYTSSVPNFAKEAAEHQVWKNLAKLPKELSDVLNPVVVYLDDILTEMPENLVNPTLKHLQEVGLTQRLIDNYFKSTSLDYEFIGFFIQFLGKHINSPARFDSLDEILQKALQHGFDHLLDRSLITQNLKRFANADSTSSLVVLAEEIIDLVNIKHSLTDNLLHRFDPFLAEATQFYTEIWAALPRILKHDTQAFEQDFPNLFKKGWTFKGDVKDELIMLDKLNQNLLKFMAKFYDFRRTNIYESFPKIQALDRFIQLLQLQPVFDSNMSKLRKWTTQSLLRMIEHHKIADEPVGEDGTRKSQKDLLTMILSSTGDCLEYLQLKWNLMPESDQQLFCSFMFRQPDAYLSLAIASRNSHTNSQLSDLLFFVNKYLHVSMMVDIFKNASIISNRANKIEAQLEELLLRIWKFSINLEAMLAQSKAVWLAGRFENYKLPNIEGVSAASTTTPSVGSISGETPIDMFHSHLFGSNDVYTYETTSKGYEKILKHLLSGPQECKPHVITKFAKEIAVSIEMRDCPEEPTILNALQHMQTVCFLKSFLASFDGIGMQTLLKKHKVFIYCLRAIMFGLRFILEHKNIIQSIKSIPDSRKPDPMRPLAPPKSENLVRLTLEQTKMRFILDSLCEQLEFCWKVIRTSFELQDPGETVSKEEELMQEIELYGLRYSLLDGLSVIISAVNDDMATILDLDDLIDNVKPLLPGKTKAQTAPFPEPEQPKLLVKNVSKGYRLLDNLFRFLKSSYKICLGLLPKYQKLVNFTESQKPIKPAEQAGINQDPEPKDQGSKMLEEVKPAEKIQEIQTKVENELEVTKPEDMHYLNHQLCLTKDQFIEHSKKKLEKILEGLYPAKASIFGNDPTLTVQAYLTFLSKQPEFKRQSQHMLNKIHSSLLELKSTMFFKSDGATSPTGSKDKFRISNGFIKHFRAGKHTAFRQLQTHLSMLAALHELNKLKYLGLNFHRELCLLITWLTDIMLSFHKLVEIKSLSMEPENFRRRYGRVVQMINKMLTVVQSIDSTQKEDSSVESSTRIPIQLPKNSSASKFSHKKNLSQVNRELKQLDSLKLDLVTAISDYLSNYPTFMKQKINLLDANTVTGICNLLFSLGKDKPEIREAIRHLEVIKKICRAGHFSDKYDFHSTIDITSVRAFIALVEDQARSPRLLQESLRLEIKQYLETYESVLVGKKLKTVKENVNGDSSDLCLEEKYTPLTQFENNFSRVAQEHMEIVLKITKDRCVIHQKGSERYIALAADKKEKEFILDGDSISTMIILLKEIVRCSANIIFDRKIANGDKFIPCRQTVSLPMMMECLQSLCKRFPLLLKMVATYNISKFVRKIKSSWVKDRFFNEIKHNRNITFLQFYIRVILFVDFKSFRNFLIISSQESYVQVTDEEKSTKAQTKMSLGCWIRKTYFRELSCELDRVGQQILLLLTQPKYAMQNTNDIGMPNKYFIMRLASTYCTMSQDVASLLPYIRQGKSSEGEFRIGAIQQKLTKMVESFTTESEKNFDCLHEILSKALFFIMKMNFLCAANQQKLEEYDEKYNFKNLGIQRDSVHVHLNDFESFRAKTIDEHLKTFRKTTLIWHDASLDLNRFKDIRDYSSSGEPLMMSGARWGEEDGDEDLGEEEQFDDEEDEFDDDEEDEFGLDPTGSEHEGSESRFEQDPMMDAEVDEFLEHNQDHLLGLAPTGNRRNPYMPSNHSLTTEYMSADPYEYSDEIDDDDDLGEEELDEGDEEMDEDEFYGSSGEEEGEEEMEEADAEDFQAESDQDILNVQDAQDADIWRAEANLQRAFQNLTRPRSGALDLLNFGGPAGRGRNPLLLPPGPFLDEFPHASEGSSDERLLMDEDSSERSSDNMLRIRFSSGVHDDITQDLFTLSSRISPFSPFDPLGGASLRTTGPIEDAFYELGASYPFFDCIRVSGMLQVILVDQQLNDYITSFESILESWEVQHAFPKWSFFENSIALFRLRESNREDQVVLKNYMLTHDKRRLTKDSRHQRRPQAYQIRGFQIGQRRRSIEGVEEELIPEPRHNHLDDLVSMMNRYNTEANRFLLRDPDFMGRPPLRRLNSNQEGGGDANNSNLVPILLREVPIIHHQLPIQSKASAQLTPSTDQIKDPSDPLGLDKFLKPAIGFDWAACGLEFNFLETVGVDSLFFSALDLARQADLIKCYLKPEQIRQFNLGVSKMIKNDISNNNISVPNPIPPRPRAILRNDYRTQPFSIFSSAVPQGLNRSRSNSRITDSFHDLLMGRDRALAISSDLPLNTERADRRRAVLNRWDPATSHSPRRAPSESENQSRSHLSRTIEMAEEQVESGNAEDGEEEDSRESEEESEQNNTISASEAENENNQPGERPPTEGANTDEPINPDAAVNQNRFSQENVDLLNTFPPDLREEVLLTYPMDYINTLTPELILEATRLRLIRGNMNFGLGLGLGMGIQRHRGIELEGEHEEDASDRGDDAMEENHSDSSSSKSDRNVNSLDLTVFMKINTLKETFLERFLTSVITNTNTKSPFVNLLGVAMANFMNQAKIYDAFMFILEHPDLHKLLKKNSKFPPKLPPCGTSANQSSISHKSAYQKVALRLLAFMSIIVRDFPTYFQKNQWQGEKISPATHTLTELCRLRQQHKISTERNGFWRLIDLFGKEELSSSKDHLEGIVEVITQLLRVCKPKKKELDENMILGEAQVNEICNTLVNDNMNNQSLSGLSGIISVLCGHPDNLNKFISEMNKSLQSLLDSIRGDNKKLIEALSEAVKKNTVGHRSFIGLVAGKLGSRKKEQRVAKVFKTIEQLFEKYFEVTNKKHTDLLSAQRGDLTNLAQEQVAESKKGSPSKMIQEEIKLDVLQAGQNQIEQIHTHTAQKTVRASRQHQSEDEDGMQDPPKTQQKKLSRKPSEDVAHLESLVDEETMKEIRSRFSHILEDQDLMNFWLDLIELLRYFNKLPVEVLQQLYSHFGPLLPLIESFFIGFKILCDDDHLTALKFKTQRSSKKPKRKKSMTISNLVDEIEDEMQGDNQDNNIDLEDIRNRLTHIEMTELFTIMCESNKNFLNYLIEKDLGLLNGALNCIVKRLPRCISFDNKRLYFQKFVKKGNKLESTLNLSVRRNEIFSDSFHILMNKSPSELKRKLQITFSGEEGNDAGGLTREWFLALSKQMLNPDYGLFKTSAAGETFQPNPFSNITQDHIRFFKFIGIVVGKVFFFLHQALQDGFLLDAFFTRSFYKHMCGAPIHYTDMENIDPEYYKNLCWILKNPIDGLDLTFSYEAEKFGEIVIIDLKENGRHIPVAEETKLEYVNLVCYARMATEIKDQVEAFLEGLEMLIPREMLRIFDPRELELMISGLPEIDCSIFQITLVKDLRDNTEYVNYTKDSQIIQWFWEVLGSFSLEQKANFIQFVTGTSKVPLDGFKSLKGIGGQIQRFQIHKVFNSKLLPTSHTCLNQLELPEYDSKEKLKKSLEIVLEMGKEGFGFV